MNLTDLFDLSLTGRRKETALEFQGHTLTFGDIDVRSNRMANLLAARGFTKGDRLCVYLANGLEIVDVYLACVKLGVIFVPINILYKDREISHILADAEPKAVIGATSHAALLNSCSAVGQAIRLPGIAASPEGRRDLPPTFPIWQASEISSEAEACSAERPKVQIDGDDPAGIIYTSGTTGASKGAILSHNNFAVNAVNLLTCWRISSADRFLLAVPLFHVHGLGNGLHCWLMGGFRMRMLERFEHQTAAATMLDFRPTLFFGVPAMYVRLLDTSPEIAREIGAAMRLFVSGSAPLPAQVMEEFRALFGHLILERYGMSETLMNISNPCEGERRPGTVGLPLPGVSVKILDGELYVRGPNVFAGYWKREEATRDSFVDGYFRTGDLAVQSGDGYYTLQGRKSDLIISGGFNIYPREIEEFLEEQEGVGEAAVVGAADRVRGEVPVAYIVPKGVFDAARVEAVCREKLASFKVPRAFVTVEKLPRTALGKVQKRLLPAP